MFQLFYGVDADRTHVALHNSNAVYLPKHNRTGLSSPQGCRTIRSHAHGGNESV